LLLIGVFNQFEVFDYTVNRELSTMVPHSRAIFWLLRGDLFLDRAYRVNLASFDFPALKIFNSDLFLSVLRSGSNTVD
jgi:hypothetical protein